MSNLEDEKFVLNLPYHLTKANMLDDLSDILTEFEFIEYKIFFASAQAIAEDYELALQKLNFKEDDNRVSLKIIAGALNLSLSIIEQDKSQLFAHFIGRLSSFQLPKIQCLLSQIKNRVSSSWLCPIRPNLMPPNTYLFRTLLGHTGSVNTLTVTNNEFNELILVSGSSDGTIQIWDLKTGRNITTHVHNAAVQKILITSDGKQLISAHRNSLSKSVQEGATSSFSIAMDAGILKICDLDTGETRFIDRNNPSSFRMIAKTDDDEYLICQSHKQTFKVFNLNKYEQTSVFRVHSSLVESEEDRFNCLDRYDFDFSSEMALSGFGVFDMGESPVDGSITAIPGSKNMASSWGDGSLKIWNVETGEELFSLLGHSGSSVGVLETSKDGQLLISGSSDNTIKIWNLNTGQQINELKGHQSYVTALAVINNGRIIISGSSDKNIKVWNLEQRKNYTLWGHNSRINSLLITPDEKNIISGSNDGTIKIWSLKETYDENKFLPHHSSYITGIDVFPDNQKVVSTSADGTVKVWDLNTGQLIDEGRNLWGIANGASVTPDGRWVISGSGKLGYIMLWSLADVGTGFGSMFDPDKTFEGHNGRVAEVVVTPDGTRVISVSDDRTLQVWDLRSQRKLLTLEGHENYVHNAAVTPDSKKVVSVSKDETLIVWDLSNGHLLKQLYGHTEEVVSVTVTPNGKYTISGSEDKTIIIWDIETGEKLYRIEGHDDDVMDLKVFPDGKKFLSVSSDRSIKIWNIDNQNLVTQFIGDYPFTRCAVTRDGSTVIAGDGKGYLHFFSLKSSKCYI